MAATPQIDTTPYLSHSRASSLSRVPQTMSPEVQVTSKPKSEENPELSAIPPTSSIPIHHHHHRRYFHPALVLQNSGSVARDHLASERTFLAYIRTSLGLASAGIAFVQLFAMSDRNSVSGVPPLPSTITRFATPLGLSTLGMAFIVLIIGAFRYFVVQQALKENRFPSTRMPIVFISFGLGAVTAIAFGALLSGKVQSI